MIQDSGLPLIYFYKFERSTPLLASIASLALTAVLAWLFVVTSKFTSLADETVGYLSASGSDINPQGLLLAGVAIGSLGVLDDVTVTQVSAVWELKHAKPDGDFTDMIYMFDGVEEPETYGAQSMIFDYRDPNWVPPTTATATVRTRFTGRRRSRRLRWRSRLWRGLRHRR